MLIRTSTRPHLGIAGSGGAGNRSRVLRQVLSGLMTAALVASGAIAITAFEATVAPQVESASAAPSLRCNIAGNGSFEEPNIQDPGNPVPGDAYVDGYNQFRTSQGTISGWQTIAGTIDILRYYNNASDGSQSIDMWGTEAATLQQTFTGLVPGVEYTFAIDYSGLEVTNSRGTVQLSQGGPFSTLATLAPTVNAVDNGAYGTPTTPPKFTVTWSTFEHTFIATGTAATIRIQNQVAPSLQNTGLFVDNFRFNGGAACEDFGDAPFATTDADGGAAHLVVGYDSDTNTAPLMLGSTVDLEDDGAPSAGADADDTTGVNDEDAFSTQVVLNPGATGATLTVPVTNSSGDAATLYGWIDANDNGAFEASEFASVPVPDGATSVDLEFAGLSSLQDGTTPMVRLRLTSDSLTDDAGTAAVDERAQGAASDGEVEDHLAQVATFVPISCSAPFVEDFGTGANYGPPLPGGQTTYLWEGSGFVQDGEYGLMSALPGAAGTWWHTGSDHTVGDTDGRMMLVNASFTADTFFQRTFTHLVPGASYDFSAWITNANSAGSPILPNVKFRVVDPATGTTLSEIDTGAIAATGSLVWDRFALQFTATQPTVRLEMVNNAAGGNGNDLAIDDISLSPVCEFGDAPAGYGTLASDDGAGHIADGPALGTERDAEVDGQPGSGADGDDTTGAIDDEDGITGPIEITVNEPSSVTVSATNDSDEAVTLAGWIDLDGDGQFQLAERATVVVPANSGTADYILGFPAGTTAANTYARFRIYGEIEADPQPTGSAAAGEVEDYPIAVLEPALEVEKTSDATAETRVGDVVTYTVTATNTGDGDFSTENPAVVWDDLTAVLDDATYNGDATASDGADPTYSSPVITWRDALAAGDSVTLTYSVTLVAGGDGEVRNVAFVPLCDPADDGCDPVTPACDPPVGGVDPDSGVWCAESESLLPQLTHSKVADTTELPADGGVVNYTVTVTNEGPGVFTLGAPGEMTDDLSEVLDDATYNGDAAATTGTVTFNAGAGQIEWSGALGVGDVATITYSVTYDDDAGDQVLLNVACLPVEHAQDPTGLCRSVQIPGSALQARKTSNPGSGSTVASGQHVTYTLHFENTGQADATVATFDEMADVLDDATLTAGPTTSNPSLVAAVNGTGIDISGTVPVGATYTVTYTVTVDAFDDQGDHVLGNVLGNCLAADPTCRSELLVRHLTVTKSSDASATVNTGDTITYTVTVDSDGTGDYTATTPAVVADDLSAVLDDAVYSDDASAPVGDLSYAEPILTWSGPLAAGDGTSFSYSVVVSNEGDHELRNSAGAVCSGTEICDPVAEVSTLLPHVVPSKSSDPVSGAGLAAGDVVTYTLSWNNDGLADGPVDSTDDLLDVLDDATVTSEPVSSNAAVTAVRTDDEIRITGTIQPGQTITVTYQVTINADGERGNNRARNVLTPDGPLCLTAADCPPPATAHPLGELDDWKTVDPASGMTVQPGQVVTFTLHFENVGQADVPVSRDDVLTEVLDDATITDPPTSSDPALTVSPISGGRFTVTGTLAPDQLVTVTYTVTVNANGDGGDGQLANVLVASGATPPATCVPADPDRPDCTISYVSNVVPSKSADPPSGASIAAGQRVTYTLTFENASTNPLAPDAPVDFTDHLVDVLDDATLTTSPVASDPSVTPTVSGETIRVVGAIPPGDTVTVTYAVTVSAYPDQGNHILGNVIAPTGSAAVCAEDSPLCTRHELPSLAVTGVGFGWIAAIAALALILGGVAVTQVPSVLAAAALGGRRRLRGHA